MKHIVGGVAAGAASALYLAYTYNPILLHGTIHAIIFTSGMIAMYFAKMLTAKKAWQYVTAALPIHLAIHFFVIKDIAQLMGVSHALNLGSLP